MIRFNHKPTIKEITPHVWTCLKPDVGCELLEYDGHIYIIFRKTPKHRNAMTQLEGILREQNYSISREVKSYEVELSKSDRKDMERHRWEYQMNDRWIADHFNITKEEVREHIRRIKINRIGRDSNHEKSEVALIIKQRKVK